MEEVRISDWPEPPGSNAWLPAYGYQHEIMDKDDYFSSNGDNGSNHALYLETIVEETSDDLRSERSSAATWLSDSDADSVIHVRGNAGSECDSESEREWACPAKRRRRERASSPGSTGSLSRSSSLAQFESLERSCAAPASPSLSPDSLESPVASPPPAHLPPAPRTHLSAENLSEDSGYSERARRPPPLARRQPEIAHGTAAGSAPNLASPSAERRPARAARAVSLPAELDVCAEPRRRVAASRTRFRQTFEVTDSLTVSVADLTALDYRGGPRRPRQPPPPPPRQQPPPPPPPPRRPEPEPVRDPSVGSDDTTESEIAFAREMEATARRLDEAAKRALEDTGNYDRELSVLTAKRLRDSWGAWDDVLHELRRRLEPSSASPSPPRSPSPDAARGAAFTSTPRRAGDARVRSTPELRARAPAPRDTPEELRASLQLVSAGVDGGPPARSVSAGSKGVTFSPVVAEVSWREASASTEPESESAATSASDDAADAEVEVVGGEAPRAPRSDRSAAMADARAPRSRIAGFLSRFANFRFSGRKEKKGRAGASGRGASSPPRPADAGQGPRAAAGPQYVRIPLKEEGVSRPAAPPAGGVAHRPPRRPPAPTPAAGVLETDVDTQRTVLHARSLLALAPPGQRAPRPHKSMEFLLDKESAQTIQNDVPSTSSSSVADHNQMQDKVTVSNTGIQRDGITSSARLNTFLKVVPVIVSGPTGSYETYALLDDGSTATLIDSSVATHVGLSGPEEIITANGVGGLQKSTKVSYVDFYIKGKYESDSYLVSRARAMSNLNLRAQSLAKHTVQSYEHLADLTDVLSYTHATPTVLIGAEHWHLSITREVRSGKQNDPVACRSLLGWTLYGVASGKTKPVDFVNHCQLSSDTRPEYERLEFLVKEHYKLDSLGISKRETLHCKQDLRAIEILESTTRRLPTGRYEVGLPWRDNIHHIPDSYPQALSRFLSLERRMIREPEFADAYQKFISNMIEKGYAEECNPTTYYGRSCSPIRSTSTDCPASTDPNLCFIEASSNKEAGLHSNTSQTQGGTQVCRLYLPHFGVYHPQKRKLRVVHDAAATNQGVSLNSLLLQGPDLLESLLGILFRFREGAVAMTADIKEMFPQIRIREHDRDALRFLWRDVKSKDKMPLKEYRMTAVVFGASSSPFTALYIKNKNAMSYQSLHPEAVDAIIHDHYMDDYLGSHDDVDKAAQLASEIVDVHSKACFEMRGWVSNNSEALRPLPQELRAAQPSEVHLGSDSTSVRALGVSWNPLSDTIGFRTGLDGYVKDALNKRKVLSHLMKVYDPLGLLGPVIVKGRILLQEAWRSNIDWDTPFKPSEVSRWHEWFKELLDVSSIKISRWYAQENGEPLCRELHVFADASELAYACVAYWRLLYPNGSVKLALISSKARVAPLKPTSIPRLELQAALIASRLAHTIKESHHKKPTCTFLWTDSRTVLSWLRSDARTFKPFVAHRVGEITENTCVHDWKWVPTELNVADDATRMKPLVLNSDHRWFAGPSFLCSPPEDWPVEPAGQPKVLEERKQSPGLVAVHLVVTADLTRFSDWLRLLRATARVLQVVAKFRSILDRIRLSVPNAAVSDRHCASVSASTTLLPLSAELMNAAERHILQRIQSESFAEEIQCIAKSQPIPKTSRLVKLSPVMGEDKLLRLAGRIRAVQDVEADVRSPILLDGRNAVVRLLVHYFHRKAGHANNQMVINEIRQKYWVLRLRNTLRTVASQCLFCRIRKAKPMSPMTGDLPQERLAHHRRPFTYTGLDYFGPINVTLGRRKEKRWVGLFTCMTSRAVHLELVHSLSADSAIMSLRRFIARRGTPETIFSDNGTCFVGANRLLKEFYRPEIKDFAANRGVKWSFIPAAAPFFGGSWERQVRTVKVALNATLHERAPKEEILITLLLEAEAIVNSRPLSHVSLDYDDEETLTPFHFLIGSSSNQTLPQILDDRDLLRRADWRKALRLADHFWNRWVKEILPTMQPRHTSKNSEANLKIDDLVVIVDENLPRGTWPRGRVAAVFPGKDGVVRVVDVATAGGLLRRPAKKLVRLVT